MTERCQVAVVGSGFAGSLLARVLAVLGVDVVLLERGTHPRFAIGESTTPLANLSLERLARRYGLTDCQHLSAHGRWLEHLPELRRGLKRGFTFYRHHPGEPFTADRPERLLVAASPRDAVSDTHWLRADVDHHLVRMAVAAGVDYRERVELSAAVVGEREVHLTGRRDGAPLELRAGFVVDASGPGGFLARRLPIASALRRTRTRAGLLFSHFEGVRSFPEVVPGLPDGPYPDDRAAVHHLLDEGWMYSLRFDHGVTSAGFALSPRGLAALAPELARRGPAETAAAPAALWRTLLGRYPTLGAVFADAKPLRPLAFRARMQHRLACAAGSRWALLPHAYAFVDPLFSTGIAWGLRAIERLALCFESARAAGAPAAGELARYQELLAAEADQMDVLVAGAYEALAHFDLFAAHAMIYFASVSYTEARQRLLPEDGVAWQGFLGVDDPQLHPLPRQSARRLRRLTRARGDSATAATRAAYQRWVARAIAARNIAGLAEPARSGLYPVDLDVLVERHALLGMSREAVVAALPRLR